MCKNPEALTPENQAFTTPALPSTAQKSYIEWHIYCPLHTHWLACRTHLLVLYL
jgi:hypothetical protein